MCSGSCLANRDTRRFTKLAYQIFIPLYHYQLNISVTNILTPAPTIQLGAYRSPSLFFHFFSFLTSPYTAHQAPWLDTVKWPLLVYAVLHLPCPCHGLFLLKPSANKIAYVRLVHCSLLTLPSPACVSMNSLFIRMNICSVKFIALHLRHFGTTLPASEIQISCCYDRRTVTSLLTTINDIF